MTEPLDYAIKYAGQGWSVFPIWPGTKRPATAHGFHDGTTDLDTIRAWWERNPAFDIGIATGPTSGVWVLDVDIDETEDKHGDESLAALEMQHGDLPRTITAITPRGGTHHYFRWPEGRDIRNSQSGTFAADIDVRGDGGYVVVEPSTFVRRGEYVGTYTWDADNPDEPADAPEWLIRLAEHVPETPRERPTPTVDVGTRPGDLWAAQTPWETLLRRHGWTYSHADRDGTEYWCRPGKEPRDGISASVNYGGADVLKVFTSSVPQLRADETYTKLGFLAAMEHRGDISAAASALRAEGFHAPAEPRSVDDLVIEGAAPAVALEDVTPPEGWPVASVDDIDAILSGNYEPPLPEILSRSDGARMLYAGRVNSLAGEPGGGKTWIALHAAAEVLNDNGDVVLLDFEDRLDTAVRRLHALGAEPDAIRQGFHYVSPTFVIRGGGVPTNVLQYAGVADLVIIDSLGEALAHSELDQNIDKEVASWMSGVARKLADGGAAVLMLDHVTKDAEHRGRWAIGSHRKLAAIDGVAYMMTTVTAATKDAEGRAVIKCSKDRMGNYQHGSTVADVRLIPDGDDMIVTLTPPQNLTESGETLLTGYMERISKFLEEVGEPMSGRAIEGSVEGGKDFVRKALRQLCDLGHTTTLAGPRGAVIHRLDTPYRELSDLETDPARHRGRPRRDRGGAALKTSSDDRGTAAGVLDPPRWPVDEWPSAEDEKTTTAAGPNHGPDDETPDQGDCDYL